MATTIMFTTLDNGANRVQISPPDTAGEIVYPLLVGGFLAAAYQIGVPRAALAEQLRAMAVAFESMSDRQYDDCWREAVEAAQAARETIQ
jgi:hypothetical protein